MKENYSNLINKLMKKSKEELIEEIIVLQEIEKRDRKLAESFDINKAYIQINDLYQYVQKELSEKKNDFTARERLLTSRNFWSFLQIELNEMKDGKRVEKLRKELEEGDLEDEIS